MAVDLEIAETNRYGEVGPELAPKRLAPGKTLLIGRFPSKDLVPRELAHLLDVDDVEEIPLGVKGVRNSDLSRLQLIAHVDRDGMPRFSVPKKALGRVTVQPWGGPAEMLPLDPHTSRYLPLQLCTLWMPLSRSGDVVAARWRIGVINAAADPRELEHDEIARTLPVGQRNTNETRTPTSIKVTSSQLNALVARFHEFLHFPSLQRMPRVVPYRERIPEGERGLSKAQKSALLRALDAAQSEDPILPDMSAYLLAVLIERGAISIERVLQDAGDLVSISGAAARSLGSSPACHGEKAGR